MDRPVAVPQYLYRPGLGKEAGRDLQARVAAGAEDDLLPARDGRDARREVDREDGSTERCSDGRRVVRRRGRRIARVGRTRDQALQDRRPRVRILSVNASRYENKEK